MALWHEDGPRPCHNGSAASWVVDAEAPPFDLGMWAIFCDSLIGNKQTRDLHSNDALLCIHADSATALMDSRHLALALLAKLA